MLVKAALNGARDPAEHSSLPVTPEELTRDARAAVAAGAGALHLHVRDATGAETLAAGDVARAAGLRVGQLRRGGLRVLLEPTEKSLDDALRTMVGIERVLASSGITAPRLLHGSAPVAWELVAEAARRGYDSRIGLEDTLTLPDGRLAPGNAALVAEARRIVAAVRSRGVTAER